MENLYLILFACFACYAYNRKSVAFAMPKLIEEGLDRSHAGLILTCMNLAFALNESLAGVLSDRISARVMFSCGLLVSGTATLLFAGSESLSAYCGLWFLNGLAQGCGWPPLAKILRQRAPASQFGTLWSFLSAGSNASGTLSPFVAAFFILSFGWRASLIAAGLTSIAMGVVAFHVVPAVESSPSEKETKKQDDAQTAGMSAKDVVQDPFLQLVSMGCLLGYCTKCTAVDWGSLYLMEERGRSQTDASAFQSSVESGGLLGRILAGYLADRLVVYKCSSPHTLKQGSKPNIRMTIAVVFLTGSVFVLHALQHMVDEDSSTLWITFLGFCLGVLVYGPIAVCGICSSECAPANLAGTALAVCAFAGNAGAVISSLPMCYLAKFTSWSTVYLFLEMSITTLLLCYVRSRNLHPKCAVQEKVA